MGVRGFMLRGLGGRRRSCARPIGPMRAATPPITLPPPVYFATIALRDGAFLSGPGPAHLTSVVIQLSIICGYAIDAA